MNDHEGDWFAAHVAAWMAASDTTRDYDSGISQSVISRLLAAMPGYAWDMGRLHAWIRYVAEHLRRFSNLRWQLREWQWSMPGPVTSAAPGEPRTPRGPNGQFPLFAS